MSPRRNGNNMMNNSFHCQRETYHPFEMSYFMHDFMNESRQFDSEYGNYDEEENSRYGHHK
jgi:hypothetical protein